MLRIVRTIFAVCAVQLFAGCTSFFNSATPADIKLFSVLLLGEVHDNAEQHQQRAARFKALLEAGARPALLLEQFDRERQADIDKAIVQGKDADALIAAATSETKTGWNWAFYKPFISLALQYQLPVIAANVSRSDASRIYTQGLLANGFIADIPDDIGKEQTKEILQSHCGLIDNKQAAQMSNIQVARDQFMARQIQVYQSRGVVLLAGNGHVRKDIGVPRWLPTSVLNNTRVVGYLEALGSTSTKTSLSFDEVITTTEQKRSDPCESMRQAVK